MREWQDAQTVFDAVRLHLLAQRGDGADRSSLSGGTSGGGGGGGVPRMFCRMYLPRITTDVRVG